MSTPIEIVDELTRDSVLIDEYGLLSIETQNHRAAELEKASYHYAEFTLPTVLEIITLLSKMAEEMLRKERLSNDV